MALGLYVSQLTQRIGDKHAVLTINHFNPTNGESGHSAELAANIAGTFLTTLNAMQGDYVENLSIYTRYVTDGDDSAFLPISGNGSRVTTADDIPAYFNTISVRWRVSTTQFGPRAKLIKRGGSHLCGLLDEDVINGKLDPNFQTAWLDDLEASWLVSRTLGGESYYACIHVNPSEEADTWKLAGIDALVYGFVGRQGTRFQK